MATMTSRVLPLRETSIVCALDTFLREAKRAGVRVRCIKMNISEFRELLIRSDAYRFLYPIRQDFTWGRYKGIPIRLVRGRVWTS